MAATQEIHATVEDMYGMDHQITLVLQSDGQYHETELPVDPTPTMSPEELTEMLSMSSGVSDEALSVTVDGRFGEEHHIKLVRRPNGTYQEDLASPEEL